MQFIFPPQCKTYKEREETTKTKMERKKSTQVQKGREQLKWRIARRRNSIRTFLSDFPGKKRKIKLQEVERTKSARREWWERFDSRDRREEGALKMEKVIHSQGRRRTWWTQGRKEGNIKSKNKMCFDEYAISTEGGGKKVKKAYKTREWNRMH